MASNAAPPAPSRARDARPASPAGLTDPEGITSVSDGQSMKTLMVSQASCDEQASKKSSSPMTLQDPATRDSFMPASNETEGKNSNKKEDLGSLETNTPPPPAGESVAVSHESKPISDASPQGKTVAKKRVSRLGAMATRKKRKSLLADMSAAVTAQPVKLNTLEKSKLDWETYKGTTGFSDKTRETMTAEEREELEAQTRGGGSGLGDVKGYLHRKEFLDRVHDRLDEQESKAHFR